jgi:hypothetical protein
MTMQIGPGTVVLVGAVGANLRGIGAVAGRSAA